MAAAACNQCCNVTDVAGAADMADWREMELGAPEIARLGIDRLNSARIAMLGTLRPDGSPRISPIEPFIVNGRLLVGAMTWSRKAEDLRRDPRYVLHSVVTDPDSGQGDDGAPMVAAKRVQSQRQRLSVAHSVIGTPRRLDTRGQFPRSRS